MKSLVPRAVFIAFVVVASVCHAADPYDSPSRTELKRVDLSGAPGMEVISSIVEFKPGDVVAKHFHHGIEVGYVVQGALVQYPGHAPTMIKTGTSFLNLRDVAHGGDKIVGKQSLKLFTVHVVDKGKPLYQWVK